MAEKPKSHIYRVPKDHPVAGKMKPGEVMHANMRMMAGEPDDDDYGMEEMSSAPGEAAKPPPPPKKKAKSPADFIRQKREIS